MRRTSLGILAVTFAGMTLAACTNPPPPTVQSQAPSVPVTAGGGTFQNTPVNAGFGNQPVTSGYHDTQGAPTYQP